jgi:hypothetical protein
MKFETILSEPERMTQLVKHPSDQLAFIEALIEWVAVKSTFFVRSMIRYSGK